MKKLLTALAVLLLAVGTVGAADLERRAKRDDRTRKWYVNTSLGAEIQTIAGIGGTWSVGAGVGIHRMLGEKFSLGVDLAYQQMGESVSIGTTMVDCAGFFRLAHNFYYVPEIAAGGAFMLSAQPVLGGFAAGVSPLGLEYRPSEAIGLRVNLVAFSFATIRGVNAFAASLRPSFGVCFRF